MNQEAILQAAATIYAGGLSQQLTRQCGHRHPLERITKTEAMNHALELVDLLNKMLGTPRVPTRELPRLQVPEPPPTVVPPMLAAGDLVAFCGTHPAFAWARGRMGTVKCFDPDGGVHMKEGWCTTPQNLIRLHSEGGPL